MVKHFFSFLKSIPNKFLKWSFAIDTPVFIVAIFGKPVLENIKIGSYGKMYDTLCAFLPWLDAILSSCIAKVIVIIYTAFCVLALLTKKLYRPFAILIKHSSLGYTIGEIDKELKKSFWFKKIDIDVSNLIKTNIPAAIKLQDEKLQEIKSIKRRKCFYYGIAHTPLIFRLGYQIGLKDIKFLHSYQRDSGNRKFKELYEYDQDKHDFSRFDQGNLESKSQGLLVTIATTYPISKEDLSCFDLREIHTLEVEATEINMGTDFFSSYRKIISYCSTIIDEVRKICKQYNIKKIHIVLSTSVNFTFVLGQYFNNNQIPETIVYHYKKGEEPCYPWGISIQKNWENAYIDMKTVDTSF